MKSRRKACKEAVADLHGDLNLQQNVKRFETGTYGQLKSGQQRYNTGPERHPVASAASVPRRVRFILSASATAGCATWPS